MDGCCNGLQPIFFSLLAYSFISLVLLRIHHCTDVPFWSFVCFRWLFIIIIIIIFWWLLLHAAVAVGLLLDGVVVVLVGSQHFPTTSGKEKHPLGFVFPTALIVCLSTRITLATRPWWWCRHNEIVMAQLGHELIASKEWDWVFLTTFLSLPFGILIASLGFSRVLSIRKETGTRTHKDNNNVSSPITWISNGVE